jgi:hypothetical protein
MLSPATHANGTPAAMIRSIMPRARCGLVAKAISRGMCAAAQRAGLSVQARDR